MDWGEVACSFQCWRNSRVLFDWSNNTNVIAVIIDGSLLEKSSSKMLGSTCSSKLD